MRPCVQVTVTMNAKDLRTESALSERNNDGSKYSQSGGTAVHCDRNKSYQDIGSNSLAKVDIQPARPCAVIGPDRVVPPPAPNEVYLKKGPGEPWPSTDNAYYARRPPEYPHKLTNLQNPTRNISPRQTFQENMQRVMVPPSYNSVKLSDDTNYAQMLERGNAHSKNIKLTVPPEAKFCDVPYTVYPPSNEQKNVRNPELCNVNSNIIRTAPPGWSPSSVNIRPTRTFGASELYQYPEYASCAGPRPVVPRPNRTVPEDPGYVYADPYYHQEGNIRYKPYPTVKERFPQQRYDYIGNYANSFHPPPVFPTHKYELQKSVPPHPYAPYPPMKYLDRVPESVLDGYQRNQQGSYNISYRNQIIHPNYGPVPGNNPQNKIHSYPPDALIKPGGPNKLPFDNTKAYIEYENGRPKMYPPPESYLVNEMGRTHTMKSQVIMPNYPTLNMHNVPPNPYYKKDGQYMKNYEYMQAHYRSIDPNFNPMLRHQPVFSPSTIAISPTDSTASNDISQTLGANQEDCGYVSQSSTASGRSMDSSIHRLPNDCYIRKYYDNRYIRGPGPPVISKAELNTNNHSKDKKNIDVRQFLQMWNEGDEETETNNSKEIVIQASSKNDTKFTKAHEGMAQPNQEQLYVLGLVNVPSEELGKYEHIQKVSKLPENIKGYNHIDLLKQFEQVTESSNMSGYASPKDFQTPLKGFLTKQPTGVVPPRPLSPLDVEAKISQSVIHKEVGCNFEIRPCSPKMLNVEVATPVQNILERERAIQKVANPGMLKSPRINSLDENIDCNIMKRKDHRINTNNEPIKIPSCKMVNNQFSNDNSIDSIKNSYSLHDLESNSGLGLASLPRLDNDIELNFPEVNQQFINANKSDSIMSHSLRDLPTLEVIDKAESAIKDNLDTMTLNRESELIKSPSAVETEKEFSKLSKYRKAKVYSSDSADNLNAVRTDSVIIKNPENIKNYEENLLSSPNFVNKEMSSDIQKSPMNLTSQGNTDKIDNISTCSGVNEICEIQGTLENAIDFSLNKSNTNDLNENSSTFESENGVLSRVKEAELPTLDSIETSNFESVLANDSFGQAADNDKTENSNSLHNPPVVEVMRPECLSPVSSTENAMNISEKQECLSPTTVSKYKEPKTFLATDTLSIECIETADINNIHYSMDIDENRKDISDQLDLLKSTSEKSHRKYDNLQKQEEIKNENIDQEDITNNGTTILEKQRYNEETKFSEFSNTKEVITKSDSLPKTDDINKVSEIVDSSNCIQSNNLDLPQPRITKSETESNFALSSTNNNVSHALNNYESKTNTHKSYSPNLPSLNNMDEHKQSDCQTVTTENESVCDTDFISENNDIFKHESIVKIHTDDTQKIDSRNSRLETSDPEQASDSNLDLPFSNNEVKYSYDWQSDTSERKSYCSLSSPRNSLKDHLSDATQSESDRDFYSSPHNIGEENKFAVEFSKDNLTDLLDEISNCPMDIESTSDNYYEDITINNNEENITNCIKIPVKEQTTKIIAMDIESTSHNYYEDITINNNEENITHCIKLPIKEETTKRIVRSNEELRYLSYGSKEMYSPWIQKLIVKREGCVNTVKKDTLDKVTCDQASVAQDTEKNPDPCNFECTLKDNDDDKIYNTDDCTNSILKHSTNKVADSKLDSSDCKMDDKNISDEYKSINNVEMNEETQEPSEEVTPSMELKSHDIQALYKDSIIENQVQSIFDKDETSKLRKPIDALVPVAQVQSITNNNVEEETLRCNYETPETPKCSQKSEIRDFNCINDTPEQWDKMSACNYDISSHMDKESNYDKTLEYPNKQLKCDDEGSSDQINETNKEINCFVEKPELNDECIISKAIDHHIDGSEVSQQKELSASNDVIFQQSDNPLNCKYELLDKHKNCDDQISEIDQSGSKTNNINETSERWDKQSPCDIQIPEQTDKQSKCIDEMPSESETHSIGNETLGRFNKPSDYNNAISEESGKGFEDKYEIPEYLHNQSRDNNEPFDQFDKQSTINVENPKETNKQSDYNDELSDQFDNHCTDKICVQLENPSHCTDNISEENKQSDFENQYINTSSEQCTESFNNHDNMMILERKVLSKGNDDENELPDLNNEESDCNNKSSRQNDCKDEILEPNVNDKILGSYVEDSTSNKSFFHQIDKQPNNSDEIVGQFNQQSGCYDEILEQNDERPNCGNENYDNLERQSDCYNSIIKEPSTSDGCATAEIREHVSQESREESALNEISDQCNDTTCCNDDIIFEPLNLQFDCNDEIIEKLNGQSDSSKESGMNNTISQQSENNSSNILTSLQCVLSDSHDKLTEKSNGESDGNNDITEQNISVFNDKEVETSDADHVCPKERTIEPNDLHRKRQSLKRSLSDSALNVYNNDKHSLQENDTNVPLIWPFKRRKNNDLDNDILAENLCNIIQNNRRNSVASFYNEENVSFCIVIDNSCIIAEEEESDEQEKICYTALSDETFEAVQNDCSNDDNKNVETTEVDITLQEETYCEYPESFILPDEEENLQESWVEDVACVETVISDDIAEDIEISAASSPKEYLLSDYEESDILSSSEHTDKVKYIYGDKMCSDDAQFVETLYNTPQMDVVQTLVQRKPLNSGEFYDKDSLEKILSESNEPCMPVCRKPIFSEGVTHAKENINNKLNMDIENSPLQNVEKAIEFEEINVDKNLRENVTEKVFDETQDDTVHSCESSVDNVFNYKENDENTNQITSSSPEVSSTTSEEKGSAILLKITNYKGSRVSQVNDIKRDTKRPSCKFTEEEDYGQSQSNYSAHRPLLTKAAQKYIPPLKESIRDLKVKLSLPQHSLMKLKQLKKSKDETKRTKPNIPGPRIPKKPKPKFEDVLKRIEEIQYEMHSKKNPKKSKKSIPKVVIKKNENGSHYASTSNKEEYNPDLTGNKWQPWVFIEKNDFIDKMAIRNKTKAIYSHRKRTYVLAEKFKKYKSVSSAKFVISPPISDRPSGLKYTIRLKHSY